MAFRPNDRGNDRSRRDARPAKSGFKYNAPSADSMKKRASQNGSSRDQMFAQDVNLFTPAEGDNTVRVLPPTWDDAQHFGYDVYVHYDVGPDGAAYLCLEKMEGKPCPICEERKRAADSGDSDYADKLKPNKRVLVYVVDRDKEKEGLKVWSMSWTIDRDLCALAVDKRTGEVYAIDDPEDGYDISFERKGTGITTKYLGLQIARRPSSLGNDAWLDQITRTPIPELLNFFDYDHIQAQFSGSAGKPEAADADDDDTPRRSSKYVGASRERATTKSAPAPAEPATYDDVVNVRSIDELIEIVEASGVRCRGFARLTGDEELEEVIDIVLDCLDLSPPPKARKGSNRERDYLEKSDDDDDSPQAKLRALKSRYSRG